MRVAVIDGQGGGLGKTIIEKLRAAFGQSIEILALGTNALATSVMIKAGADEGASGENAIMVNASGVDAILGSVGIIAANAMLGELTPAMARSIAESRAQKILIPLNRCHLYIAGTQGGALPQYIDEMIEYLRTLI